MSNYFNLLIAVFLYLLVPDSLPGQMVTSPTASPQLINQHTSQSNQSLMAPDFLVSVNEDTAIACTPSDVFFTVYVDSSQAFTNAVNLAVTGVPAGATATFASSSLTPVDSTLLQITGLGAVTPGTYTLVLSGTSTTGTKNVNLTLIVPVALSAAITANTSATCFGASNGSLTTTGSGGTMPYSYLWPDGQTTPTATGLAAGNHSVTITDAAGCVTTVLGVVNQPVEITINLSVNNTGCSGTNGRVQASVSNATNPINYNWSNGASNSNNNNIPYGVYSLTVTDGNGCTATESAVVGNNCATCNLSSTTTVINNVSCNGGNDGAASITVTGATAPLSYLWDNGVQAQSTSSLPAGTAFVTAVDANGCTHVNSVTITQPNSVSSPTSSTNETCAGNDGSVTTTPSGGTAPYTFFWSTGATTATVNNLSAGGYSVTTTDANGCTRVAAATVSYNCTPCSLTATASTLADITCNGLTNGSVTVNASGGTTPYIYNWSTGSGAQTLNNRPAGMYYVTVTDAGACSYVDSTEVVEPPLLTATVGGITDVSCNGNSDGSISVTAAGGTPPYTYSWNTGQSVANLTNVAAGNYQVTVTDANGCVATDAGIINAPAAIVLNTSSEPETCFGNDGTAATAPIGGTAPYTYLWSTGSTSDSLFNLTAGSYSLTLTDANGCTQSSSVIVSNACASCSMSSVAAVLNNVSCNGAGDGSAVMNPTGGTTPYSYAWSNGEITQTATALGQGTFTVTVLDVIGCSSVDTVSITEPPILSYNRGGTNETCPGGDGTAFINVSGGTPNYIFSWSNSGTTDTIIDLVSGTYRVTVTDANGCQVTDSVAVAFVDNLGLNAVTIDNNDCFGDAEGIAQAAGTGVMGISYLWSNGTTTTLATGLAAGTYYVTASVGACSLVDSVLITEPAPVVVNGAYTSTPCVPGTANLTTSPTGGGGGPYIYLWSNGSNASGINNQNNGSYNVTVTSVNNCVTVQTILVDVPVPPTVFTTVTDPTCNGNTDGLIDLSTSPNPTNYYQYIWNRGDTTPDLLNAGNGIYTVTITDTATNCSTTVRDTVEGPTSVNITFGFSSPSTTSTNDGSISTNVSGGVGPYTYLWNTGFNSPILFNVGVGTYSVTVTDANGCIGVDTFTLNATNVAMTALDLETFKVIPNPNRGEFILKISSTTFESYDLKIVNTLGQIIHQETLDGTDWSIPMQWNQLPAAVYYISLSSSKGKATRRWIKLE